MKLDRAQLPYWSVMLMHDNNVVIEVQSVTFNPRVKSDRRQRHEEAMARVWVEINKEGIPTDTLISMLLQDDITPLNKPST